MSTLGRPTEYKEEFIKKVDEYLESLNQTELPMIAGFAKFIGVAKSSIYLWKEKYKDFSDALESIMTDQEIQLINDGIYGGKEVNATIVKLLLQNNHGMREKQDLTSDGKQLPQPIYNGKSVENEE